MIVYTIRSYQDGLFAARGAWVMLVIIMAWHVIIMARNMTQSGRATSQ